MGLSIVKLKFQKQIWELLHSTFHLALAANSKRESQQRKEVVPPAAAVGLSWEWRWQRATGKSKDRSGGLGEDCRGEKQMGTVSS